MKRVCVCLTAALVVALVTWGMVLAADPIKVGIVLPLTGTEAKFGEIEKNSFLLALEEINGAGGVKGQPIDLIIEDDTSKPEVGRSAVEKLVAQNKVIVIGGGYSSSVTFAMAAVAQQRKVPFLVNTGSADKITEQGWDYVFRLNQSVSEYPAAVIDFLKNVVKPQTIAILHENTLFGQEGAKYLVAEAEKAGMKVVKKDGYQAGAVDFKPLLIQTKAAKPDVVYMISYIMDASLLMRQAKELDFNPKLFVGGAAGFTLPEFLKNAGDATENVFSATLWTENVPYRGARQYFDKYRERFKSDTEYHGAEAYAALYVLADAIKRAKELTPAGVREALAATDMTTPDTETVFGPVKFVSYDKKKQQNRLPTYVVQWQQGKLETVWPKQFSTKPYVYPISPWKK